MMPVKRTNSYTGNTVYRLLIPGFPSAAQQALAAASRGISYGRLRRYRRFRADNGQPESCVIVIEGAIVITAMAEAYLSSPPGQQMLRHAVNDITSLGGAISSRPA
jgi:hypothetical protein